MKKFLYPLFAVLTSVALVLGGFSFSSQQGRFCAFEVQRAEAAVPLTAPYIFGALLGCFGVSVAGYAGANGQDVETALNNAWESFQAFAASDVVSALNSAFSSVTSFSFPLAALNLSHAVMQAIADWILNGSFVSFDSTSPALSYGGTTFNVVSPDSPLLSHNHEPYSFFSLACTSPSESNSSVTYSTAVKLDSTNFSVSPETFNGKNIVTIASSNGSRSIFRYDWLSRWVYYDEINYMRIYVSSPVYISSAFSKSIAFANAGTLNPSTGVFTPVSNPTASYEFTGSSTSVSSSDAVTDIPDTLSSAISSGDASAYADAVSTLTDGQYLDVNTSTVANPSWSDVFGEIPATLDSILEAVQSGFAGVLEGVQTFFRPVVEFFAPLDIRDSDDIGDLVISNASKEHTFTSKFPFCLVNDYKSLYEKAISPVGGSSGYPTPGHFVVKMPAMNGLNSEPITLDMTYIFTNKYMGLTLGQISQLFVAIACLAMFLHWVGDMINVVKSPNYGYVTVEGEAVGRGR